MKVLDDLWPVIDGLADSWVHLCRALDQPAAERWRAAARYLPCHLDICLEPWAADKSPPSILGLSIIFTRNIELRIEERDERENDGAVARAKSRETRRQGDKETEMMWLDKGKTQREREREKGGRDRERGLDPRVHGIWKIATAKYAGSRARAEP